MADGTDFDWNNPEHQELFIAEHVKLINMGFEAVFIDSAKHIGGYDMANYTGVGALPEYEQMQYILMEIRRPLCGLRVAIRIPSLFRHHKSITFLVYSMCRVKIIVNMRANFEATASRHG